MKRLIFALFAVILTVSSCSRDTGEPVRVAVCASVGTVGLSSYLTYMYREKTGRSLEISVFETEEALREAKTGGFDLLISNDAESNPAFLAEGYGLYKKDLLRGRILLLIPESDPAQVKALNDVGEALRRIAASGVLYYGGRNGSYTSSVERKIWRDMGVNVDEIENFRREDYNPQELLFAANTNGSAYLLVDAADYLVFTSGTNGMSWDWIETDYPKSPDFVVRFDNPGEYRDYLLSTFDVALEPVKMPGLETVISAIPINPDMLDNIRYDETAAFIKWLFNAETLFDMRQFIQEQTNYSYYSF